MSIDHNIGYVMKSSGRTWLELSSTCSMSRGTVSVIFCMPVKSTAARLATERFLTRVRPTMDSDAENGGNAVTAHIAEEKVTLTCASGDGR